ncbi:hypothetical protein HYH03_004531 [Edaphochlamys debaryana]|uniref:Uncharacterized protein n=1 Tax=Edaphochlamys debaryana TaxID=47281 RepID=A0A835Y7B1_9CHLO|nr:hypothetical protein HYH03_004531 [Edaphochlamys debaryana]|eukprot:KAG2497373.1 hypothetical protein HYH03_004531 [Edaphochlamys debaryana]
MVQGSPAQPIAERGSAGVEFFATCHPGLEQVVAGELRALGYSGVRPAKAGVAFSGSRLSDGYAANLWLRSAVRVLALLAEGDLGADPTGGRRGGQALYDMVYDAAPWSELIPSGATFSVEPRLWSCTDITSTALVWSRTKDAVCDAIRDRRPDKPNPPERGAVADVPLYVTAHNDQVRIYRDMSGNSLHRRGYRDVMHRAALNEAAAAGVLALAGWGELVEKAGDGEGVVLADPMCGSGTLLIEAALMARGIAPGLIRSLVPPPPPPSPTSAAAAAAAGGGAAAGRKGGGRLAAPLAERAWPFQRWEDYEPGVWAREVEEAKARVRPPWRGQLIGVDIHEGALSLALRQVKAAGVVGAITLFQDDCRTFVPPATPTLVVTNPPWGQRLAGSDRDRDREFRDRDREYRDRDPDGPGRRGGRGGGGGGAWDDGEGPWGEAGAGEGDAAMGGGEGGEAALEAAWRGLDSFLYRQCPGAQAWVVSGSREPFRYLKLKPHTKHRLTLSGVDVQVAGYSVRDAAARAAVAERFAAGAPDRSADRALDRAPGSAGSAGSAGSRQTPAHASSSPAGERPASPDSAVEGSHEEQAPEPEPEAVPASSPEGGRERGEAGAPRRERVGGRLRGADARGERPGRRRREAGAAVATPPAPPPEEVARSSAGKDAYVDDGYWQQ